MSRTKLAAAYLAASQLRGLANLGTGGRTKTANLHRALADNALAGLLGAGAGAAIDDDSALQGALIGAAGGIGAHQLRGLLARQMERNLAGKVTDVNGFGEIGEPTALLNNIRSAGAGLAGGLGGLGGVGISNMIDDDDESLLYRLGLR